MIPRVSVLMPMFNAAPFLNEAIESILNQTYTDFEFIIIDDASTDNSISIAKSFGDERIVLVRKKENGGIIESLNVGLEMARGEYIVRMDSDDISLPQRIERQVVFMDAHPEVGVCGTCIETIGLPNKAWHIETEDARIRIKLLRETHFCHPSVIMRNRIIQENKLRYRYGYEHAEDYDLWVRIASYCQLANLPEVLLKYRIHGQQISASRFEQQTQMVRQISLEQISKIGVSNPSAAEKDIHIQVVTNCYTLTLAFVKNAEAWCLKLRHANSESYYVPEPYFSEYIQERWHNITLGSTTLGMEFRKVFVASQLSAYESFSTSFKTKFLLKSLLKI